MGVAEVGKIAESLASMFELCGGTFAIPLICLSLKNLSRFRSKGAGELYIYLPLTAENKKRLLTVPPLSLENPDFGFSVGRGAFFIPVGRWVSIAIRVKLNAVGLDDGKSRFFL